MYTMSVNPEKERVGVRGMVTARGSEGERLEADEHGDSLEIGEGL